MDRFRGRDIQKGEGSGRGSRSPSPERQRDIWKSLECASKRLDQIFTPQEMHNAQNMIKERNSNREEEMQERCKKINDDIKELFNVDV